MCIPVIHSYLWQVSDVDDSLDILFRAPLKFHRLTLKLVSLSWDASVMPLRTRVRPDHMALSGVGVSSLAPQ